MRNLIVILMCYLSPHLFGETLIPFANEQPLELPKANIAMSATLSINAPRWGAADGIEITIRVENKGETCMTVFNPFGSKWLPIPLAVAVYDDGKAYIGDLCYQDVVSRRSIMMCDWVDIPQNGSVGFKLSRRISSPLRSAPLKRLPKGKYFIQAIFFNAYFGNITDHGAAFGAGCFDGFYPSNFDRSPRLRSNVVEVEVVE